MKGENLLGENFVWNRSDGFLLEVRKEQQLWLAKISGGLGAAVCVCVRKKKGSSAIGSRIFISLLFYHSTIRSQRSVLPDDYDVK